MQKVIVINLAPYENFADPIQNGKPDFRWCKIQDKIDELNYRRELKKGIDEENVTSGITMY